MAEDSDEKDTNGNSTPANEEVSPEKHATSEANGHLPNGSTEEASEQDAENAGGPHMAENVFQLTIKLPHAPGQTQIMVTTQEQMQDVRQSLIDTPHTIQYSCFHLEHKGQRINDFIELSEVPGIVQEPECTLVEDPYTEAQARMHIVRVRDLIGAAGHRTDLVMGIDAGTSLCDRIELPSGKNGPDDSNPVATYDLSAPGAVSTLISKTREPPPKTVKSLSLSAWNPPPYHLRMRGHLLYLQVTTNEGEQHYITSAVTGFYVNKSTNNKFDPTPRSAPKAFSSHSLLVLLGQISPSFDASLKKVQECNSQKDPLASYQLTNSIPSAPWLVSPSSLQQHQADLARTQEPLLIAGAENADTLRDWNEEFQSTRELPKETVQDRVLRERLTNKLFAEYNEAAIRGAVLVARGEVQPLNPTESRDAQIFVYNNVFYSFGADGVGTFAGNGGDEAARVATGKDLQGVKAVNQVDINGLFTAGTVIVDYLGKRIIGQSIVPGIFKQREEGEHQIDYGGVEGKEIVATLDTFVQPFRELSKAMRVKRHAVWDKDNKKHELEASVETKGLLGTDGRKYVLDLYRLTPLDVTWLEQHYENYHDEAKRYPHRMTVLRPELVESYRVTKLREFISKEMEKKRTEKSREQAVFEGQVLPNGTADAEMEDQAAEKVLEPTDVRDQELSNRTVDESSPSDGLTNGHPPATSDAPLTNGDNGVQKEDDKQDLPQPETVDMSGFSFFLNPDVFSGQRPQTDEERGELDEDEAEVRAVCKYLTSEIIPRMIREMQEGEVAFPMDGQSLVRDMHKRGVNVRYLGDIARLCTEKNKDKRVQALGSLVKQEMVARAFKHFANAQLRPLPPCFAQGCVSHLLNCLLGTELNAVPKAEIADDLQATYYDVDLTFAKITPDALKTEVKKQVELRFRFELDGELVQPGKQLQLLREVCLKLGFQLEAKEYLFSRAVPMLEVKTLGEEAPEDFLTNVQTNGNGVHPPSEAGKKRKKKITEDSPSRSSPPSNLAPTTFRAENVLNIVPIYKEASPRSVLAEEALDAGRMSIQQDQRELGQEILLESLSLHEQIYGVLHPEVARVYYALSTLYYSLEEKAAAVELAKKAVIVSERTMGIDNAETVLAYLNLSLFEHAAGNTKDALAYVRHALDLWKIVYGIRHPDSITTINNTAVMLQTLKQFHDSRLWFEASLDICEDMSGKHAVPSATLLFQLAQALALDQDPKAAVAKMRESYNIFKTELGPENQNTKEAETWLETLTTSAVSQAKQANALLQSRRLLLRGGRAPRVAIGTRPQPPAPTPASVVSEVARTGVVDQRSVDELLKYINGESTQTTPKKKTANPKRRQQAL